MNGVESYIQVYEVVSEYIDYYNNRYRHGSLNDRPPAKFYESLQDKEIEPKAFIA